MNPTAQSMSRRQGTIVIVQPEGHPLSVDAAKRQLRIDLDNTSQDTEVAEFVASAHRKIENDLGFPIMRQTRRTSLYGFPCGLLWLGGGADLEVVSVKYYDQAGVQQTVPPADYIVDAVSRPAYLMTAPSKSWPSTQTRPGAVEIEWQAGWQNPSDVPESILHAMKLLIGHWDQNREAVVVGSISSTLDLAVDELLQPHRVTFIA
jgi:uncharacterized phiE125 gp8 family phage protein